MARALINVPAKAKRGDVIEIKALISHPMETGYRTGPDGALVPREAADPYARALGLRVVSLTDPWAARRFVICMRSRDTLTAAARLLVDYLHQRAGETA